MQSKTASTRISVPPTLHPHHKYQTLLHYISSFMTDLRLDVAELKDLVYGIVNVQINQDWELASSRVDGCEQCEVEFMMYTCRKVREDVLRVLAVMRGYLRSLALGDHLREYTRITTDGITEGQGINSSQKVMHSIALPTDERVDLPCNDVGFLTFRENEGSQMRLSHEQYGKIVEQNGQLSQSILEPPHSPHQHSVLSHSPKPQQKQRSSSSTDDRSFSRVYQLINLIRDQASRQSHRAIPTGLHLQQPQGEQTQRREYKPINETPTAANDTPMAINDTPTVIGDSRDYMSGGDRD